MSDFYTDQNEVLVPFDKVKRYSESATIGHLIYSYGHSSVSLGKGADYDDDEGIDTELARLGL